MAESKSADRANTLKIQGNQSMRTGGFAEAVTYYSRAIELAPDNHVLYSNRALAFLKLKKYAEALADADACIRINPAFVKAYSTKGVVLTWMGRTAEARAAYQKGLEVDPDHAGIRGNLAGLAAAPTQTAAPAAAAGSLVQFLTANPVSTAQSLARLFMVVMAVVYIIPVFSATFSYTCYRRLLMACMAHYFVIVFRTHGRPKWSARYAAEVFQNPATTLFFMSLMFFTARPRALAIIPILSLELVHLAEFLYNVALRVSPGLANTMATKGVAWGASLSGNPNFAQLSYQAKWGAVSTRVCQWSALGEVVLGIALIVEVFTPMRNILLVFMYWQMMQVRYMASDYVKAAFRNVDQRITGLTTHRLCPGIVNTLYMKIRGWLAQRVTPPAAGAEQQRPRCNIM